MLTFGFRKYNLKYLVKCINLLKKQFQVKHIIEIIKYIIDYSTYPIFDVDDTQIICNNKKELLEHLNQEYGLQQVLILSIITLKESFINLRI